MKWKLVIGGLLLFLATASTGAPFEAEQIFSLNNDDSWNRIFTCLFTRTVTARLTDDFPEAAPFSVAPAMGFRQLQVSDRLFERFESGDRAIDPLYPSFLTSAGAFKVLDEPLYSELTTALNAALRENVKRSPLDRALMQADVWAAHDILIGDYRFNDPLLRQRRDVLLSLLARFIKTLTLSSEEIGNLPSNYAAAVASQGLPDLFSRDSEWIEVQWFGDRLHNSAANFRRAARVFMKPAAQPRDRSAFVEELRRSPQPTDRLAAVALIIQNLLIDSRGMIVPSLIYEVQFRTFLRDAQGNFVKTQVNQHELNRKLLLGNPASGGLVALDESAPAYLPNGGNDFDFASPVRIRNEGANPILGSLRTRCVACHSRDVRVLFTFNMHGPEPPPSAIALDVARNEHARYVAERKSKRDDFKRLGSFQ